MSYPNELIYRRLLTAFSVIGWYKAIVCALAFLASLGLAQTIMPGEALDSNGLILVRYCAWFCLFIALVHLKAARDMTRDPASYRYLLWIDTIFFAVSALSPLINLLVTGSLFWIWWPAMVFDFAVFVFCLITLAATRR